MAKDYGEDQLIQRSAAELFEKELGWTAVFLVPQRGTRPPTAQVEERRN